MKNKILAIGICALMLLVVFSSGCIDFGGEEKKEVIDTDGDGISDDEDIYNSGNGGIKVCITYYKADRSSDYEEGIPDPYFKIWVDIDGDYQMDTGENKTSSVYTDQEEIYYPLNLTVDIDDNVSAIYIQINAYDKGSDWDEMIDLDDTADWMAAHLLYHPLDSSYLSLTDDGKLDLLDEMDGEIGWHCQVVEM